MATCRGSTAEEHTGGAFELRAKNPDSQPSSALSHRLCNLGQITDELPHCGATWGLEACMDGWVGRRWGGSGVLACGGLGFLLGSPVWALPRALRNFRVWCSGSRVPIGLSPKKIFSAFILLYLIFLNLTKSACFRRRGPRAGPPAVYHPPGARGVTDDYFLPFLVLTLKGISCPWYPFRPSPCLSPSPGGITLLGDR